MIEVDNVSPVIAVELVDLPIDMEAIRRAISHADAGAQIIFEGCTRRLTGSLVTKYLAYEAYRPMAVKQLRVIAECAREKWSLKRVRVVHRLGLVDVGQASIVVGVSSPHRREAFTAVAWIMDEVKSNVAIWKKEFQSDELSHWVHDDQ